MAGSYFAAMPSANRDARLVIASAAAAQFGAIGVVGVMLNLYLDVDVNLSTATVGLVMAVGSLLAVPAAMLAPLALGRWGNRWTYAGAHLLVVLAAVGMAVVTHWAMAVLAYLAVRALTTLASPGMSVLQMTVVTPRWRTTMSAAGTMAITLGAALLSVDGGQTIASRLPHSLPDRCGADRAQRGLVLGLLRPSVAGGSSGRGEPGLAC